MKFNRFLTAMLQAAVACGVLTLSACGGGASHAQASTAQADSSSPSGGGPGGAAAGRHRMAAVLMSLGLTDDQKSKIRGIMRDVHKQNVATNADPETRRANFKAAFGKIDDVLTPDQRTEFHQKMQAMRAQQAPQGT